MGRKIEIGRECMIGCQLISDNPGHRLHDKDRVSLPVDPGQIGRVEIGDHVWAGISSLIIGNVCIGAGAVVRNHVPNNSVVAGNTAKVIFKTPMAKKLLLSSKDTVRGDFSSDEEKRVFLERYYNRSS